MASAGAGLMRQGFVLLSDHDADAPLLPAVCTVSTGDGWDGGAFGIGVSLARGGTLWCDRPYFTGNPSVDWMTDKAMRVIRAGGYAQIGNEQNHPVEQWRGGVDAYRDLFSATRVAVVAFGGDPARLLWTPPSPGVAGWQEWVLPGAAAYAVHAYGSFDGMRQIVQWYLTNTAGDVFVTECNPGAGQTFDLDAWAESDLRPFLDWCATEPRVRMVAYFAYRWDQSPTLPSSIDGAGTGVERVLREWTAPIPKPPPGRTPMDPAHNPFRGKLLTCWNLPPDPADLIAAGHALKLDGFEIKTADGNSSWLDSPSRHVTRAYCDALRSAGFRVLGWSYNYCDGLRDAGDRGDGVPIEEAEAAIRGVTALELEGHTFDLEIECEGHADLVSQLFASVDFSSATNVPIAAHVWADLAGHGTYPAAEILAGVDVLRPMIYRPTWTAARCWQSWGALDAGDPPVVCPVWGITEGTAPQIAADMAVADQHEVPGEAYWEYSAVPHLAPAVRTLIAGRSFGEPAFDVAAARDRLWAEAEELAAAGYPWFSQGIKAAVAQNKGDR